MLQECLHDIHGFQNNTHVNVFISPDVKYGGMVCKYNIGCYPAAFNFVVL